MNSARLIIDPPFDGPTNMAVDQALLETADQSGQITLRFYRWKTATLSIGYFQSHMDRDFHPTSNGVPLVRRKSGGGAILHDKELTYSLCIPSNHRWSNRNTELYRLVHRGISKILNQVDIPTQLYSDSAEPPDSEDIRQNIEINQKSFLCFQRRTDGDICLHGQKVVGSAQRRNRNSLLQHGSLLWTKSDYAPELPGMTDLKSMPYSMEQFAEQIMKMLSECLQIEFKDAKLSAAELASVESHRKTTFGNDGWNLKR
ncbi:MAG: biotin/lipoate A/B protein ligase family protein [Planctomycetota bacterium]